MDIHALLARLESEGTRLDAAADDPDLDPNFSVDYLRGRAHGVLLAARLIRESLNPPVLVVGHPTQQRSLPKGKRS